MSFSDNPDDQRYHAFLSHNVTDMPLVEKLAEKLENSGLSWLVGEMEPYSRQSLAVRDRTSDCGRYAMQNNH